MALADYFMFENPEFLAVVIGILLFVVLASGLKRFFTRENRGITIVIALVVSAIATWKLYSERFYGLEGSLIFVIYVLFAAVLVKIFWAFVKGSRKNLGYQ